MCIRDRDVQGSRAFRAARSGLEWALYNLKSPAVACPAASTALTIDGFSVTVSCSGPIHDEGGTARYIFLVTSTASGGGTIGSLGYAERMVSTFIEF